MKLKLKPLQARILVKVGSSREIPFEQLAKALIPEHPKKGKSLSEWDNEIRLNIELLAVYGVIQIPLRRGVRICVAPDFVVRWANEHRIRSAGAGAKFKPSISIPLMVASVLATTGCSSFPGIGPQATPTPVVIPYNAEGAPPPERMEQFYNARTGNMVYRFCVGDECPLPTPKKPIKKVATVTESNPDGTTSSVEQSSVFSSAKPVSGPHSASQTRKAVQEVLASPKTASNNAAAAAIASQLNDQRRAIQASAGVKQNPPSPVTTPVPSVKPLGVGSGQVSTPAAKPFMQNKSDFPGTGTRVPSAPSAKASSAEDFLAAWANKWSSKDADGYFDLYAKDFWPSYGQAKSLSSWEEQRRSIMNRPGTIKVDIEVVKVQETANKASVRFWQTYESKSFKSRVMKSLELVKAGGNWKIHRERLIPIEPQTLSA